MQPNHDPFGLNLLYELVKKNQTAGGCVLFLMEITTAFILARGLWQILGEILPSNNATLWSAIISITTLVVYCSIRLRSYLKTPFHSQKLSVLSFVLALLLGGFGILMLNGAFDSGNSNPPGRTFFVLFYGLPLGGLLVFGLNAITYLQTKRLEGLSIIGSLISLPIVAIFGLWHFLAFGLSGDFYPCLLDILFLIMLVSIVFFARRNKQRLSEH